MTQEESQRKDRFPLKFTLAGTCHFRLSRNCLGIWDLHIEVCASERSPLKKLQKGCDLASGGMFRNDKTRTEISGSPSLSKKLMKRWNLDPIKPSRNDKKWIWSPGSLKILWFSWRFLQHLSAFFTSCAKKKNTTKSRKRNSLFRETFLKKHLKFALKKPSPVAPPRRERS